MRCDVPAHHHRAREIAPWNYRIARGTSVSMVDTEAVEMDELRASAGARS
jgi:hypothetical protein